MKLICYPTASEPPKLRAAPATRSWMDQTSHSYAYRCLPLNIANAHGWEVLSPARFTAVWDGGNALESIKIMSTAPKHQLPISHFGFGVLTFHVNALFRTEPGYNLWVGGPVNAPKDGISALTGVVETDWAPYTFTMNWKFTRAFSQVRFEADEPICALFPMQRGLLREVEPEIRDLASDPELKAAYEGWQKSRNTFLGELKVDNSPARAQKWQKNYYRGLTPEGEGSIPDHETKLQPRPFADRRGGGS
jgi:hypothetical protein